MNSGWNLSKCLLESARTEEFREADANPVGRVEELERWLTVRLVERMAELCR